MNKVLSYIYINVYILVSKINKQNARESTILYISAIVFFLTMPFIVAFIQLLGNVSKGVFLLIILSYSFFIFLINKRYFERLDKIRKINKYFKTQNVAQKRIGSFVVVGIFIMSLFAFFIFLSFL